MDQLLQSCHDLSSLNKFIEHFLKMLQKLLETNHFQMEVKIFVFINNVCYEVLLHGTDCLLACLLYDTHINNFLNNVILFQIYCSTLIIKLQINF